MKIKHLKINDTYFFKCLIAYLGIEFFKDKLTFFIKIILQVFTYYYILLSLTFNCKKEN